MLTLYVECWDTASNPMVVNNLAETKVYPPLKTTTDVEKPWTFVVSVRLDQRPRDGLTGVLPF